MTKQKFNIKNKSRGTTKEFDKWLEIALIENAEILDGLAKSDETYIAELNSMVQSPSKI